MKLFAYSLAVFVAVLLTYLPSVRYEFVCLDDQDYVYTNRCVMSGLSCDSVRWAVTSCGYAGHHWHPLTWISLQSDVSLLKDRPAAIRRGRPGESLKGLSAVMHVHNVTLHAVNAVLLFLLIVLMSRRLEPDGGVALPVAALFALLWAIHPLRTEVVCWVTERKELLSVFFMLLTMLVYVKGRAYLLSLLFFALALSAKPVALTLPVVLFAWDWVMAGRRFGKSLAAAAPFLLLSAGAGVPAVMSQAGAIAVGNAYSFAEKVVMSVSAPATYLRQTFWPAGLSVFYPCHPPVPWVELALGAALFAGALAVCILWLLRQRGAAPASSSPVPPPPILSLLAFAVAWCLVSLVPMLGLVKLGEQPHSDRYTYWVGCGFSAVAALAVGRFAGTREREVTAALAAVAVALAVATRDRMPVWRDATALFEDGVAKSWADSPVCVLAHLLREQGEEGERRALAMLREAVMRTPSPDVRAEFAHLLACRTAGSAVFLGGDNPSFAEARYEAEKVLDDDPAHSLANEALAILEMKEGRWERAVGHFERARAGSATVDSIDRNLVICRERLRQQKGARGQ